MSIKSQLTIAVTLAVALLAYAATVAQALDLQQAKFKAEVKGVQTYTSEYHSEPSDPCDSKIDSVTAEKVAFKSTKAVPLTVTKFPNTKEPILTSGSKSLSFPTKAKVTRSHSYSAGAVPDSCPDNGGGVSSVQEPDCGTKSVPLVLSGDYYSANRVELQPKSNNVADPFERCGTGRFPYLLEGEKFGRRQSAELPIDEVFDEKIGKIITIGSGNEGIIGPETSEQTNIRWELSLTRVK